MLRRAFMWATVASLAAAAFAGIAALLLPQTVATEKILASTITVGLYNLLAMMAAITLERQHRLLYRAPAYLGIALAFASILAILSVIWFETIVERIISAETLAQAVFTMTLVAIAAAHFGLYAPARLQGGARWARAAAVGGTTFFAIGASVAIWIDTDWDIVGRALGVLAIIAVAGSAITPIAWKMKASKRPEPSALLHDKLRINATCPRCSLTQELPLGHAKCTRCKLEIDIRIDEPRCRCGYPFLGLKGDTCPECGAPIPENERWATLDGEAGETSGPPDPDRGNEVDARTEAP